MIKLSSTENLNLYIAKWAIHAVYKDQSSRTCVVVDHRVFTVYETVDEVLKLWEETE